MDHRLFQDLVPSSGAVVRRRAAVLPVSLAVHGGAMALALMLVVPRPSETPSAAPGISWRAAPRTAPSPGRVAPPTRSAGGPRPRTSSVVPAAAPGPAVPLVEPSAPPATGDVPAPCLAGCDAAASPAGSGDGPIATAATGEGPGGAAPGPVRPGGDIKPPRRVVYVPPVYPDLARLARVGGVVVLDCTIDVDGRVSNVRVISGHPLLDEAAASAVRRWVYRPTRLNGVPVAVLMTVTVRFIPRP